MEKTEEIILRGLPVSRGIGIGLPLFFAVDDDEIPEDLDSRIKSRPKSSAIARL